MSDDHLRGLNDAQKEAVLHTTGPLLIVAGAGAGKTKTITHRILHLIKEGVDPRTILAITFTNKAAKEMSDRVLRLIKEDKTLNLPLSFAERPTMSTFHALGARIAREQSEALGVPKQFTIADESDAGTLMKDAIKSVGLDPKQFEPKRMKAVISRQKGDLITLDAYREAAGNEYFPRMVAIVWEAYERALKEHKSLDFDDLIMRVTLLLRRDAAVRAHYHETWHYIHIDEYQDTNIAQYELSRLLTNAEENICVVGDMDQSIYSWRGADFRNITNFERDYKNAKVVLLEENYRSTKTILAAANEIIKKNTERKEKHLFTRKDDGEPIGVFAGYDETEEAYFIAEKARALIESGVSPEDIAVLYRANFQSRILEEAFLAADVPYQVLGVKFFARKEIKDLLSYIRAALNPESLADMKRIVNTPARGIGKATLAKMFSGAEDSLTPALKKKVTTFHEILSSIREYAVTHKVSETIRHTARVSGLEKTLKQGTEEDKERYENIGELITLSTKYDELPPEEGIARLLEDAALASDQDSLTERTEKNTRAVRLMTVHASKGLEFPYVFIAGLEQDLFPHSGFADDNGRERQEEERRLFYVALTRAEKKLFLSYASVRTVFGMKQVNVPSEFLTDLPDTLLAPETPAERTILLD